MMKTIPLTMMKTKTLTMMKTKTLTMMKTMPLTMMKTKALTRIMTKNVTINNKIEIYKTYDNNYEGQDIDHDKKQDLVHCCNTFTWMVINTEDPL